MAIKMDAMQKYSTADEVEIPEGKVTNICKQFLVHEDSGLAYKLQSEEIEGHLNSNRNRNQIVRSDCVQAKHIQEAEQAVYQQYRKQRQAQLDEQLAKELQLNLIEEDQKQMLEQQRIAEEDEKYAKAIAEREREKMRRRKVAREKAQIEKIKRDRLQYYLDNNFEVTSSINDDLDELDLSDFCMKPPDQLRGDQLTMFMAEQDEELARFLQIYENQKKSTMVKDKQELMENQDYEIARLIYEEERAKLRRIKEKRLQKQRNKHAARVQDASMMGNQQEANSQVESAGQQPVEYYIPDHRLYRLPAANSRSNGEQLSEEQQQYLVQSNEKLYDEPPIEQDLRADGPPTGQRFDEPLTAAAYQANCEDGFFESHSEETNLKHLIDDRPSSSSSSINQPHKRPEKQKHSKPEQLRYNPLSQTVEADAQYTLSTKQLPGQAKGQVNLSFVNRALPPVPTGKAQKFHNIIDDIDPTYNKSKDKPSDLNSSNASNEDALYDLQQINGLHFAQLARVEDGLNQQLNDCDLAEQRAFGQSANEQLGHQLASMNYVLHNQQQQQQLNYVHPVQPVQGQKRAPTASNLKKSKKDKSRDKCRQQ